MDILSEILIIVVILLIIFNLLQLQQKKHFKEISILKEKSHNSIINENIELKRELENQRKKITKLKRKSYEKGFADCEKNNKFEVRISEFENLSGKNWWIYSTEKYEFGFEYTLFINNLPLKFEPVKQPIKTLNKSEINEKNIKELIKIFSDIENLKSSTFKVSKSISNVKDKISQLLLKNGNKTEK